MKFFSLLVFGVILSLNTFALGPITGITHVCVGSSTTLTDATTGGTWGSSNSLVATVNATGVVSGVGYGTCIITYVVSPSYVTTPVTVNPAPAVFAITGGGSYCAGDSGVHIGLIGSQLGVNYLLIHGASSIGPFAGTGMARDFGWQTAAGTYTVLATLTSTGCSAAMPGSVPVIINPIVTDSVSISSTAGDTLCSGSPATFSAIPVYGGTFPVFQWMVNGVSVGSDSTNYTYVPANGDIVTVRLVSDFACATPDTVTGSDTMAVLPHVIPVVNITATPGTEVCRDAIVLLSAVPVYGGPGPSYSWKKNGVTVATGSAYTFVPLNGDTIHCTMISNYRCLLTDTVTSIRTTMIVDTPLTPYIIINTSPGTHIDPGQSDTLTAIITNGGPYLTFEWILNSTIVATDSSDTYISDMFSAPYPDSITCIVTGSGACRVSSYTWVYIVVSPAGVASYNLSAETLNIFPNPGNGEFTIKGSFGNIADGEVSLEVTDVLGRVIYTDKAKVTTGEINKKVMLNGEMNPGIYILTLRSGAESKAFQILIQ